MSERCRQCGQSLDMTTGARAPFCSERCRLLDLGAWTTERYRIAGPAVTEENETHVPPRDSSEE